ncbi:mannitol dehydrogenase family protein [Roseomonas sp. ACRSG]|nr:mannitol dehydrogenase family protein [Roseomonas sp. ACRSG]
MTASSPRLSAASLGSLPAGPRRPGYDRAAQGIGIVHLGLGAFHRAHQAVYTEERLEAGESGWGICGLSLRSPAVRDALAPQDGLYTVLTRGPGGDEARIIGSVLEALTVPEQPDLALARLADPATRIIGLTVTEKAYCRDSSGALDEQHPDIRHDLEGQGTPRSVPGLLAAALRRRAETGAGAVTLMTCDNLPDNGRTLERVLRRFVELRDPSLAGWMAENVSFPATMVDRIVPATTDADRAAIAALGYQDAWPIVAEPFSQWVIEDRFVNGRPRWEEAGALMVQDVHAYELMKLRCLNGAHSSLAYLGGLAGIGTVSEAMAEPLLADFLKRLWAEDVIPTLPPVPGIDLPGYTAQLEERFRNPAIRHRLLQIAMDGSQKLPQRLLRPAADRLAQGVVPKRIALAVAAWMLFLLGEDETGGSHRIDDPMGEVLSATARGAGRDAAALSDALFAMPEVFEPALAAHQGFRAAVREALALLLRDDVRGALRASLAA